MKILMIYTDWANNEHRKKNNLYGGVGYYRIIKPAEELRKYHEVDIVGGDFKKFGKTPEEAWDNVFRTYDLVWTKQIDNGPAAAAMFMYADHYGKRVVMDLDDNYFEVTPDQPGYQWYHPGSTNRAILSAALSFTSAIVTSTKPLADYYKNFLKQVYGINKKIYVAPNCVEPAEWNFPVARKKDNDGITIGWAGSITHNADLKMVVPAMNRLMKEFKTLKWVLVGGVEGSKVAEIFKDMDDPNLDRIEIKGGTLAWEGFPELLGSQGWDIGICPLVDNEFNRGKSHIKWMEYSLLGIPTVASKTFPYFSSIQGTKTIQEGYTGYLAKNSEEWYEKLKALINSEELRKKVGAQAREIVSKEWSYSQHGSKWADIVTSVCNSPIPQHARALSKLVKTN